MKNTSLNQVINALETISQDHAQINDFGFGEISDLSASEQVKYPVLWCDCSGAGISGKTLTISMDVYILDIQKDDMINEADTLSDTLQILSDVYAMMADPNNQDNFTIPYELNIEPIREGLADKVNGWKGTINVEMQQTRDRCQVPLKAN